MGKEAKYIWKMGQLNKQALFVLLRVCCQADGSDRFCTDFRKVNAVTEPDCAVLHMKYFIDWVGSEKFVMRLDL